MRSGNRLLALLAEDDFAAIAPYLEPHPLEVGATLLRPNVAVTHVYFVEEGMVSLVQLLENGEFIETGIVGPEGMLGALVPLGATAFSHEAVVQISGRCVRMKANEMRREVALRPELRDLLLRYVQALFSQISQSVVCNNQHSLQRRLARWLITGSDCIENNDLPLTHQLLSTMLGVRRSSVTDALAIFKANGLIKMHQGGVTIIDRANLQAASCECYCVVRGEFQRLLGPTIFPSGRLLGG